MIAVDTKVFVSAHREDSPWHEAAYARFGRFPDLTVVNPLLRAE